MLVGGLLDQTSSTLTQPDMDFSMQWGLGEDLADCLYIRPTDRGGVGNTHYRFHYIIFSLFLVLIMHILDHP